MLILQLASFASCASKYTCTQLVERNSKSYYADNAKNSLSTSVPPFPPTGSDACSQRVNRSQQGTVVYRSGTGPGYDSPNVSSSNYTAGMEAYGYNSGAFVPTEESMICARVQLQVVHLASVERHLTAPRKLVERQESATGRVG